MDLEILRSYCLAKPGVTEDFPFGPDTLVFRVGGKIFALTGVDEPAPQSVNLKCDPDRAIELREQYPTSILPGYHMNKKHWNTCVMDGRVPEALFRELITHSYELVRATLPKPKPTAMATPKKTAAKTTAKKPAAKAAPAKPAAKKAATAKATTKGAAKPKAVAKKETVSSSLPAKAALKTGDEKKAIFDKVKALMQVYEKGTITAKADYESRYDLWSVKDTVIDGRKRSELSFGALIIQSSYVGFYFMPAYTHEADQKKMFHPDLLKLLKGKACFHLKKWNPELGVMIKDALVKGYALYKQRGWV